MSGTIAYCSREDHTPPQFASCLAKLAQRHPDCKIEHVISNDIADARNHAVKQMRGDWIWFIDTDMLFAPETVERLLARNVEVVQVLCLMRDPPHHPVLYAGSQFKRDVAPSGPPHLVEVQSLGAGGTLYRRRCFQVMPGPWFEGILGAEDTNFAQKLRKHGFPLHVDTAVPVGHLTPMAIWPAYLGDETWGVKYEAVTGDSVTFPALVQGEVPVLAHG